jgi:hypothetical protein
MSHTITAIFDSGVFRPLEPVDLPDGTRAEVIPIPNSLTPAPEASGQSNSWPAGYFERTAGALAGEEFERPPQGELADPDGR